MALKWNDRPARLVDMNNSGSEITKSVDISEALELIRIADIVEAHNAEFERAMWYHIMHLRCGFYEIPISKWRCSAAKAASYSLPRSLEGAGQALGLDITKDAEGHRLMLKMCKPRKPRKAEREADPDWESKLYWHEKPEEMERLFEYCLRDVESEYAISEALKDLPDDEQETWEMDQEINTRGVQIDTETVEAAIELIGTYSDKILEEMKSLTCGTVGSPKQVKKTLDFLATKGLVLEDLKKATVSEALSREDLNPTAKRILELRQTLSKASTAKFEAMLKRANSDGRARSLFMYHGASTGRWAGKGIQPQNLPRGSFSDTELAIQLIRDRDLEGIKFFYGDPMDAMSTCVRPMLTAKPGHTLVCADFSSIEGRVLAWLAGEEHILQDYRDGKDPYKVAAAGILGVAYEDVTKEERQTPGKVGELACGYQGGPGAARQFGATGSDEDIEDSIIHPWRDNRPMTVKLWKELEKAAIAAVSTGRVIEYRGIKFGVSDGFLFMRLPSGRLLAYRSPEVKMAPTPWGKPAPKLGFMGVNSLTYKWQRQTTYGGKLAENLTQAVARDLLVLAMKNAEAAGYPTVMHVHDEAIAEIPEGKGSLEEYCNLLEVSPPWLAGCPIEADGWIGRRYRKD